MASMTLDRLGDLRQLLRVLPGILEGVDGKVALLEARTEAMARTIAEQAAQLLEMQRQMASLRSVNQLQRSQAAIAQSMRSDSTRSTHDGAHPVKAGPAAGYCSDLARRSEEPFADGAERASITQGKASEYELAAVARYKQLSMD